MMTLAQFLFVQTTNASSSCKLQFTLSSKPLIFFYLAMIIVGSRTGTLEMSLREGKLIILFRTMISKLTRECKYLHFNTYF